MVKDSKIMIVDDNLQNIKLLGQLLRQKNYKIAISETGEEALSIVEEVIPDLILLDIIMPGIDGYETCRKLKLNDKTKGIPVIFLSSLKESINKVEGFEAGGVDYISKPIDPDELFARVNTHLTISSLQKQLKNEIILKDKLINEINEKTDELLITQQHLIESQKIASLGYLVTGMAHELNTPLSIGITSSSLINDKIESIDKFCKDNNISENEIIETIREVLESNSLLMNSLKKLDNLIKDFKQLSIEQIQSDKKDFKILKVIENCVRVNLHVMDRNDVVYEVKGNKDSLHEGFPEAIERVIGDLTKNSVIHGFTTKDNNKISINVNDDDDKVEIDYYDNGKGIPQELETKIFDPFFTTNKSRGTGLGLSVVYNIVTQKLRGNISYIDDNIGSHFRISFPK